MFEPSSEWKDYVSQGIIIKVYKEEPNVLTDQNTGDKKP